jgi:hemerythrin
MTFMPWSPALSVGMATIDQQHHWLVDTLNQLHTELAAHEPDRAVLGQVLEGLMDYTVNHFVAEEVLFQRHAYPEALAHKAQHDQFTRKIMHLLTEFEAGKALGGEVLTLLKDWLVQHIMGTDKAYVPFLSAAQEVEMLIAAARRRRLRAAKGGVPQLSRTSRRRRTRRAGRK